MGNFTLRTITTSANGATSVHAADLDGDGDVDVLSASFIGDRIAWHENDGAQNFTLRTISVTADSANDVHAIDLDGDGDMDALSASGNDDKIAWYENDGAIDPTFTLRTISLAADFAQGVHAADVDGDSDIDVLSASIRDDKVAIYYNVPPPPDTTPDPFMFVDKTGVPLSSSQFSDPVTITGIDAPAVINVSGPGRPAYQLGCTGNFTNSPGLVQPGQTVCAFHTAAGSFATARDTLITIGGVSDTFTTTTRAADTAPDAFTFIDQTNVPRNSVRTSNAVTITGIEAVAPISIMGGVFSIGCTFTSVTAPNAIAALLGVTFQVLAGAVGAVLGVIGNLLNPP